MLLWIIGIFIALDLLVVGLFFVPPIQNFVVQKVTGFISNQWGAEIGVKRIYVTPDLRIAADDFIIRDMHQQPMIKVKKLKARFKSLDLQPLTLHFFNATATEADVTLVTYKGDSIVNISDWVAHISKPKENPSDFILRINHLKLINSHFSIANQNIQQQTPYIEGQEFDPGFFELRHIDFNAKKFQVFNDDISADIKQIGFDQYFGFRLIKGSGDFDINGQSLRFDHCKLLTPNSNLDLDLKFEYSDWARLGDFLDSVQITANVRPSEFCLTDAACYAGTIRGMDDTLYFDGRVNGCVNDMKLKDFTCHLGKKTHFSGDFALKNVTDFNNSIWDLDFCESNLNMAELSSFKLPQGKPLNPPDIVKRLGNVQLYGTLNGYFPMINSELLVITDLGQLTADLNTTDKGQYIDLNGKVASSNLQLGRLLHDSKTFGQVHFNIDVDGNFDDPQDNPQFLETLTANIHSKFSRFDLFGYPASNIYLDGDFSDKKCTVHLNSDDQNIDLDFNGLADLTLLKPNIQAYLSCPYINFSNIASYMPAVDSVSAKGFERLVYVAQNDPDIAMALDSLSLNICGNDLYDVNGFVGIDGLQIKNGDLPIVSDRIRCTAINTQSGLHKIILSSNFVNATLNTNYEYDDIKDSLVNYAYRFIPNLLPERQASSNKYIKKNTDVNKYFNLYVETYDVQPLLDIFLPELYITENCVADIHIDQTSQDDHILIEIPEASYKNTYSVANLKANVRTNVNKNLFIDINGDSISLHNDGATSLSIHDIALRTEVDKSFIDFQLSWKDLADSSRDHSHITGTFNARDKHNLIAKITDSKILLNDYIFHFNNLNNIQIQDSRILVDNLVFGNEHSSLKIDGVYSKQEDDKLNIDINDIDIGLVNNFLTGISFDGNLSANATITTHKGNFFVLGKMMATDFCFNESKFGNVFLSAGLGESGSMGFSGGIFNRKDTITSNIIKEYTIKDYQSERNKLANINGFYKSKDRQFVAKANIGKLDIGFLNTFLSSFSDRIKGTASGELSFISTPDSSYIQGVAHVENMTMGISPLGTLYYIDNQDIQFNNKGIVFDNIKLHDKDRNLATLNGHIYHHLFQNMKIDLNVNTPRLLALDMPHTASSSFYGTGYVAGDVNIFGDDKGLTFSSNNITTLKGSSVFFPITSSQSVTENGSIRFKTVIQDSVVLAPVEETGTKLKFDFNFNVTPETDVQVDVFAIGGTMRAKTNGRLHLLYEDNSDINIFGDLEIISGTFLLSLEDIVNTKLQMVPGGQVSFNGPVGDFVVNLSAYYNNKASLSNIITNENANVSRVPVNAYIHLNGQLMKYPSMNFSFELPNASQEVRNQFFMAIDTTNPQNKTKQFFIFLLTNQFMPDNASNADISNSVESGGTGILTNMINNFISRQMKRGGLGIVYKNDKQKSSTEYGINANMQFLDDRLILETTIGYYYNTGTGASTSQQGFNNFYGDFSLEYLITRRGNWRVKVYNFTDDHNNQSSKRIPGVGLALLYKQDFNTKEDFNKEFKESKIDLNNKKKNSKKKNKNKKKNK